MSYQGEAISHFQRNIRKGSNVLRDHITKPVSALVEARLEENKVIEYFVLKAALLMGKDNAKLKLIQISDL